MPITYFFNEYYLWLPFNRTSKWLKNSQGISNETTHAKNLCLKGLSLGHLYAYFSYLTAHQTGQTG